MNLNTLVFWWRSIEGGRALEGLPPLKDDDVILQYCNAVVSAKVTVQDLRLAIAQLERKAA